MTELPKWKIQYTKYRWEFMRRNPEYIEDYMKTIDSEIAELSNQDSDPADFTLTAACIGFCRKWGIAQAFSPDCSYDDMVREFERIRKKENSPVLGFDIHKLWHQWVNPRDPFSGQALAVMDGWEYEQDGDRWRRYVPDQVAKSGVISIQIDLNYSKKWLFREFNELIDEWKGTYENAYRDILLRQFCDERQIENFPPDKELMPEFEKLYKKKLKQRKGRYKQKLHSDNFDLYLKVYDLRLKGVSWANIRDQLDLNESQDARNHYKSACKLIEQGIDLYVEQLARPSKQGD